MRGIPFIASDSEILIKAGDSDSDPAPAMSRYPLADPTDSFWCGIWGKKTA